MGLVALALFDFLPSSNSLFSKGILSFRLDSFWRMGLLPEVFGFYKAGGAPPAAKEELPALFILLAIV